LNAIGGWVDIVDIARFVKFGIVEELVEDVLDAVTRSAYAELRVAMMRSYGVRDSASDAASISASADNDNDNDSANTGNTGNTGNTADGGEICHLSAATTSISVTGKDSSTEVDSPSGPGSDATRGPSLTHSKKEEGVVEQTAVSVSAPTSIASDSPVKAVKAVKAEKAEKAVNVRGEGYGQDKPLEPTLDDIKRSMGGAKKKTGYFWN
jgi:hypothetical protein